MAFDYFAYIILPILIFLSRIVDVSLGTFRIILISKGYRLISSVLGFFEVLIWIIAAQQIFASLNSWILIFAYALGFATGTYVGVVIEQKVSLGKVVMRVITKKDAKELIKTLAEEDFPITSSHAVTQKGKVKVIYIVLNRKHINAALKIVQAHNPDASYSIEDIRYASDCNCHVKKKKFWRFGVFRKSK